MGNLKNKGVSNVTVPSSSTASIQQHVLDNKKQEDIRKKLNSINDAIKTASNDTSAKLKSTMEMKLKAVSFYLSINILCYFICLVVSLGVGIFGLLQFSQIAMVVFYLSAHVASQIICILEMQLIQVSILSKEESIKREASKLNKKRQQEMKKKNEEWKKEMRKVTRKK